ncbi:MAG: amidohydrolase [Firmicutes bacterium]|nr:amidohydrolase [Bacillota bacterium]
MLFKNISILDENLTLRENMYVGIKGERIDYIGTELPIDADLYGVTYDGKGKLLMSAFYNTHAHSPMTLMRGYGEGLSLSDWLNTKIFPFEDHHDSHSIYWGTMLAMAESLATGIVSSSDMYSFCDDEARAVLDSHAKMNISRGVVHFGGDVYTSERYTESVDLIKAFPHADQGRVIAEASMHAEYTSNPEMVEAIAKLAKDTGSQMHVHLSETKSEHEACKEKYGKTPAKYFLDLGLFDVPTTAAHCVWLEDEDFDILASKGVTVATNPVSNMKLASGIANVPEMMKRGINVGLGTDSVSSNNSLNFFEEMKILSLAGKVRSLDPTVLTPDEVLKIATINGAKAQGRPDCGALKLGNKADLIVVNVDAPHMCPIHDIKANLVFSATASDVVLTMVDGEVVYKDGDFLTIDIEKTKAENIKAVNRILGEL